MTGSERDMVIGLLALGLLSAGLTERARVSLRATGLQLAPGARIRTSASQSGLFGAIARRASRADVYVCDGNMDSPAIPDAPRTSALPVHVRRSSLDGRNVVLLGVSVRRLRAVQTDVTVDGGKILAGRSVEIIAAGHGTADIVVDGASIEDQVRRKLPQLREIRAALGDGTLTVNAGSAFPPGRLTACAQLEVRNDTDVVLSQPRVWLEGQPLDGSLVEALLGSLNPVFSLRSSDGLAGHYAIRDVRADEGVLRVGLFVRPRNIRKAVAP